MENPWLDLPISAPFVLQSDRKAILRFNESVDEIYKIHLELLPEPFLGSASANVVLLNLNPGYNTRDNRFHENDHYFIGTLRNNLCHAQQDYPFYVLDPKNAGSSGHGWWYRRLRRLIERYGSGKIANEVLCVEFFPYHSTRYKRLGHTLPSQEYSFRLVREAITRNAIIVVIRAERRWLEHVPELNRYAFFTVINKQNPAISERNLPEGFKQIIRRLG